MSPSPLASTASTKSAVPVAARLNVVPITPLLVRPRYGLAFLGWAIVALGGSLTGALAYVPPLVIPVMIWTPVVALVVAYRRVESFREWARAIDLRIPILYHLVRVAFGAAFLVLLSEGRLPAEFARPAGWGDLVAGGLAPVAALVASSASSLPSSTLSSSSKPSRWPRRVVVGWNTIGLIDMLVVIVTAQRLSVIEHDPQMMSAFSHFPFSTIPLFVVPVVLATHALVYARRDQLA